MNSAERQGPTAGYVFQKKPASRIFTDIMHMNQYSRAMKRRAEYRFARRFAMSIVIFMLTLGACRDSFPPDDPGNPTDPSIESARADLLGRRWCLDSFPQPVGNAVVESKLGAYIEFDATGRLTGFSGCNDITAKYTASKPTLSITGVDATKRACPAAADIERQLYAGLEAATDYVVDGNRLRINYSADGVLGALWFVACQTGPIVSGDEVPLATRFLLPIGATVRITGQPLEISIGSVRDQRCPTGTNCILPGDATLILAVVANGSSSQVALHTNPSDGPVRQTADGYTFELLALDPHPDINRVIVMSDYVATLMVTKN